MKFFETSLHEPNNISALFIEMTRDIIKSASHNKETSTKTANKVVASSKHSTSKKCLIY